MTEVVVGPPQLGKLLQNGPIKNTKLGTQIQSHKTQLPRKVDGAQSSIKRRFIPPKDIGSGV
jgi:hypothetical protein